VWKAPDGGGREIDNEKHAEIDYNEQERCSVEAQNYCFAANISNEAQNKEKNVRRETEEPLSIPEEILVEEYVVQAQGEDKEIITARSA